MDINELLDLLDYVMRFYRDQKHGTRFGVWEYFSLTDLTPSELAKIAVANKRGRDAIRLRAFGEQNLGSLWKSDLQKRINFFHSVDGYELTPEDKMNVFDKLSQEGYPFVEGIVDRAFRYYVKEGIDSISMQDTRENIINFYNIRTSRNFSVDSPRESKLILVKERGKVSK